MLREENVENLMRLTQDFFAQLFVFHLCANFNVRDFFYQNFIFCAFFQPGILKTKKTLA